MFFDAPLRDRFIQFAEARGLAASWRPDAIAGFVVDLADNLDDGLADALEDEYDALMSEQMDMVNADDDADALDLMGVTVKLPDGSERLVRVPASLARRLLQTFDPEEVHQLVEAIAAGIANADSGPICCRAD
jgi:hypothetical protein